ncbi:BgTH12-05548 [Blumeria graminis f. sp. triticale]|uniref:Bgt-3221 n=3 Tax=Blumeria graminis TaxID=34373 RepID=A0A9X9MK86_BLUGR|nr:hypothetical protein BGT96224_3221 [Blumeria graminis f. sp. tritici 96224]CAD6503803.1 BgTH12-05548 [Blumeria graminis f. sp. triticale]VDB90435.1 Bgt-3221 [Blumeria graminis f. sp. tritici]
MTSPTHIRAVYRSLLRELPYRRLADLSKSPLHARLRQAILSDRHTSMQFAEQVLQYTKAQRLYVTLVERYNPGMNMDQGEKIRLTARRVGMQLPVEFDPAGAGEDSENGGEQGRDVPR